MKSIFLGLRGLLTALATGAIVLGALSLTLTESLVVAVPTAQPQVTSLPVLSPPPVTTASTQEAQVSPTKERTPAVFITPTALDLCPAPAGWKPYTIHSGDTLDNLATTYQITVEQIKKANCLVSTQLLPGTFIYLPKPVVTPSPSATLTTQPNGTMVYYPSPVPCGPPSFWVRYSVKPGDTLFLLSRAFGVSVSELQFANCMGSSTLLRAGMILWVPNVTPRTPVPSKTPVVNTAEPTGTFTATSTSHPSETPTFTATVEPTITSSPTTEPTVTLSPTITLTETEIPTSTVTGSVRNTPIPESPTPTESIPVEVQTLLPTMPVEAFYWKKEYQWKAQ